MAAPAAQRRAQLAVAVARGGVVSPGSIIELDKLAGEPVDILVNNRPVARGEVVVIDENFGVRVTDIISKSDRIKKLK